MTQTTEEETPEIATASADAQPNDLVQIKIVPRWVSIMDGWANIVLVSLVAGMFYLLWHTHDDVMSLQLKADMLTGQGKLKPEYREQMDDLWRHQMDWRR